MNIKEIGHGTKITYTHGDENPMCPHCASTDSTIMGNVSTNGFEQNLRKCNQCNALYTKIEGGFYGVMKEAAATGAVTGLTLTSSVSNGSNWIGGAGGTSGNSASTYIDINPNNKLKIDEYSMKQALDQSAINANIQSLKYTLENLITEVREIVRQNNSLQEKLATDPLINMREKINDFNLK